MGNFVSGQSSVDDVKSDIETPNTNTLENDSYIEVDMKLKEKEVEVGSKYVKLEFWFTKNVEPALPYFFIGNSKGSKYNPFKCDIADWAKEEYLKEKNVPKLKN